MKFKRVLYGRLPGNLQLNAVKNWHFIRFCECSGVISDPRQLGSHVAGV